MPESVYVLDSAHEFARELERLDELNVAFTEYFGGRLSFAPLEETCPGRILEIGSGSGAWAIDAANRFPNAKVIAVDLNPLPARSLPENLQFLRLDITDENFPFEKATFDIIHVRLVLLHIPNVKQVVQRIFDLLKPGGWIILEDPDDEDIDSQGNFRGIVSTSRLATALLKLIRSRGADPCVGREHTKMLRESACFSDINSNKVALHISRSGVDSGNADPTVLKLTEAWKRTYKSNATSLPLSHSGSGLTEELVREFMRDVDDPTIDMQSTLYFTWARKKNLDEV